MRPAIARGAHAPQNRNPLAVRAGERVRLGERDDEYPGWRWGVAADGRAAWVPEAWFEIDGDEGVATRDYDAREIAVEGGEAVVAGESWAGWTWVETADGRAGWVPEALVEFADEPPAAEPLPKLAAFGTSVFTETTRLALEHGAVNLGQGFPDFDGPAFVREAAEGAIRAGHNQYARPFGLPELCRAIAAHRARFYGLDYDAMEEVTVTAGATEALFATFQALLGPGDEAIVLDPAYDAYRPGIVLAGARPVAVPLRPPAFALDAEALERAVTPRTRALVLNTPHNPLGKVFARAELEAVADVCRRRGLVVISDEAYEHMVFDGTHVPIATLPGMRERTVMISSAGKTFGFTGWKIGYACAPRALTAPLRLVHQYVTFTNGTPFQHAVAEGLAAPDDYFRGFVDEYRARRDRLCAGLGRAGFDVLRPAGTYFAVVRLPDEARPADGADAVPGSDGEAFCRELPARRGVAAIPVAAFCAEAHKDAYRPYVRFAFCKRDETLDEAIRRLGVPAGDV